MLYVIVFFAALLYFLPKENLYFFAEHQLKKEGVVIDDEVSVQRAFGLELEHPTFYFRDIPVAKALHVQSECYILYNRIVFEKVRPAEMLQKLFALRIEKAQAQWAVWDPAYIRLEATGAFGSLSAEMAVASKHVVVTIVPAKGAVKRYRELFAKMKKVKGGYRYEHSF